MENTNLVPETDAITATALTSAIAQVMLARERCETNPAYSDFQRGYACATLDTILNELQGFLDL